MVLSIPTMINFDDDIVSDKLFGEQNPAVSMIWENEWLENEQIAISNLTFLRELLTASNIAFLIKLLNIITILKISNKSL